MEKYRNKIKTRIKILYGVEIILFILMIISLAHRQSSDYVQRIGSLVPIVILVAVGIVNSRKLLQDEKLLKESYNKANDERRKAILAKAGLPMMAYISLALLLIAFIILMVTSNYTIFFTLYFVALLEMAVSAVLKIIYMKKM